MNVETLTNLLAEQSVIGAMMLDGNSDAATLALDLLAEDDFYYRDTRIAWKAISEISRSSSPIDLLTVTSYIDSHNLQVSFSTVAEMAKSTPGQSNLKRYAELVKQSAILRTAYAQCLNAADAIMKSGDPDERISTAMQHLSKVGQSSATGIDAVCSSEVLDEIIDDMEESARNNYQVVGTKTGYENIDHFIPAMQPGDFIILAARPSMGKTTLAMNIAENVAYFNDPDGKVLFFSLEMPKKQLVQRSLSRIGGVYASTIRDGSALSNDYSAAQVGKAMSIIKEKRGNFMIDDRSGLHIAQMNAKAKRAKMKMGKISLIVVDYIQIAKGDGENQNIRVSSISAGLKEMAKNIGCPVLALSQLKRTQGRPTLQDLRDSGSLEQDCDIAMFLHDEDYEGNRGDHSLTEIIIAKQRNGSCGSTFLQPELKFNRFADTKRLPEIKAAHQPVPHQSARKYSAKEL
jgi:replicative DNA helicase